MMLQQIDKKKKIYFYLIVLLFLTTINNFNFEKIKSNIKNIKSIEVEGLSDQLNIIVKKKLDKFLNYNIFFIHKENIIKEINQFHFIEKISARKEYPSKIYIKLSETNLLAITRKNNNMYFIGSNGKLIDKKYIYKNTNLPNLFGNYNEKEFLYLVDLLKSTGFKYHNIDDIYYYLNGRWDIKISNNIIIRLPSKNLQNAIKVAKKIIDKDNIGPNLIIDLRIPNQVILSNGKI